MIASIYIFARVLLSNIFLQVKNNKDAGQGNEQRVNDVVEENFKVLASILYYLFMQVLNAMMEQYERLPDEAGNDVYSKKMLAYPKV